MGAASFRALARIRQNHRAAPCLVEAAPDADGTGPGRILFETPQRAVAPGQSLVLYSEEGLVLGGGIIEEALDR